MQLRILARGPTSVIIAAFTLAILAALCPAQDNIVLQGGAGETVTFSGQGAGTTGLTVQLGGCSLSNSCVLYGTGTGSGALGSMGLFLLDSGSGTVQLSANGDGGFAAQTSIPILFPYFGFDTKSGAMGLLLNGNLDLTGFSQTSGSANGTLEGTLNLTGGVLAGSLPTSALSVELNLEFQGAADLGALSGTGNSLGATFSGGSVTDLTATPEPSTWSMLLLGGLMLLGCGWRHHRAVCEPSR